MLSAGREPVELDLSDRTGERTPGEGKRPLLAPVVPGSEAQEDEQHGEQQDENPLLRERVVADGQEPQPGPPRTRPDLRPLPQSPRLRRPVLDPDSDVKANDSRQYRVN